MVRVFSERDLPGVVDLFGRVFPENGWAARADCANYFREILFNNPWRDLAIPSWVAEVDGIIVGFVGVIARPMQFRGTPIRVAVVCSFIVDSQMRRSLTAMQLAQAMLSGPQDLTFMDGVTDKARVMWQALGGQVPLPYNLHWIRPLRPAGLALGVMTERLGLPRTLSLALAPVTALADGIVGRWSANRFLRSRPECTEEAADPGTIVADMPEVAARKLLQPLYDERALAWVLGQSAERKGYGALRARRVLDRRRRPAGWYIYYLRRGGVSEVLQLAAQEDSYELVLRQLLSDAWRHGAAAVRGRLDPDRAIELSRSHCWLRWEGPATAFHSRRPEIAAAVLRGDAFLSRLDGEWWTRFVSG